jgi:hypothetical protein
VVAAAAVVEKAAAVAVPAVAVVEVGVTGSIEGAVVVVWVERKRELVGLPEVEEAAGPMVVPLAAPRL